MPEPTNPLSPPPAPDQVPGVIMPDAQPGPGPDNTVSPPSPDQAYDFITSPESKPKRPLMDSLPGGNSIAVRIGLAGGGLIILIIIFAIFKSIFIGGPNFTALITVAQDQQELIHLATSASQQTNLSADSSNAVATMQFALISSKSQLISYLATNHKKINEKQLGLKVSAATDSQLDAAVAAGTYNETLHEVIKASLSSYMTDLQRAYQQYQGKKGRALLSDSYNQAQLMMIQLGS